MRSRNERHAEERRARLHREQSRSQIEINLQSQVTKLNVAVEEGLVLAVERLLNRNNVNKIVEEQTPLQLVRDCIFKANTRNKMSNYYSILHLLLKMGANPTDLSDKDWHILQHVSPLVKYRFSLPKATYGIEHTDNFKDHSKLKKFAREVFNEGLFEITRLQQIDSLQLDDYLIGDEDFTIKLIDNSQWAGRHHMGVKLGNLYIVYNPEGKGGFQAKIYTIAKNNGSYELTLLHNIENDRYSNNLEFDAIIPFYLDSFCGGMTWLGKSSSYDYPAAVIMYGEAYEIKQSLINSALGINSLSFYIATFLHEHRNKLPQSSHFFLDDTQIRDFYETERMEQTVIAPRKGYVVYRVTDTLESLQTPTDEDGKIDLTHFKQVEMAHFDPAHPQTLIFHSLTSEDDVKTDFQTKIKSLEASVLAFNDAQTIKQSQITVSDPENFCCPITLELMKDPVTTMNGKTYERIEIEAWIESCVNRGIGVTDPISGEKMNNTTLIPNRNLKEAIDIWQDQKLQKEKQSAERHRAQPRPTLLQQIRGEKMPIIDSEASHQTSKEKETESGKQNPIASNRISVASITRLLAFGQHTQNKGKEEKETENRKDLNMEAVDDNDPPEPYCCGISQELMEDPVMTPNGNSYENDTIREWVKDHGTDPLTRKPITLEDLVPNIVLRNVIENYQEEQRQAPKLY